MIRPPMPDSLLARCRDVIREVGHAPTCGIITRVAGVPCCDCPRDERLAAGLAAALPRTMWCSVTHGHGPSIEEALAAFREAAGAPEGTP